MGISTIDSLINARLPVQDWFKVGFTGQVIGGYHSPLFAVAGLPGAGSLPAAGINGGQVDRTRTGVIGAPAAVANKLPYLNAVDFAAESGVGSAFLVDRLWENSGINVTINTLQSITPVALPPRDVNGSANGVGVGIALEITSTIGAVSTTGTVTYTDSDGNTGGTAQVTIPSAAVTGTWLPFPLASGDYGVRVPTAFQLGASVTSGSMSLVMYRRVGRTLRCLAANISDSFGPADGGGPLYDLSALQFIYILSATSVGKTAGSVQFAQA